MAFRNATYTVVQVGGVVSEWAGGAKTSMKEGRRREGGSWGGAAFLREFCWGWERGQSRVTTSKDTRVDVIVIHSHVSKNWSGASRANEWREGSESVVAG